MKREEILISAERELIKGKEHLDEVKNHYNKQLELVKSKNSELDKYKQTVEKIKKFTEN